MADKMMRIASRNSEGKARAIKSNENDSLIITQERFAKKYDVEQGDFKGKITGKMTVPHIAYRGFFDSIQGINLESENWFELTKGEYDSISVLQDRGKSSASPDKMVCHLFSFNLLELLKNTGKVPPYIDKRSDLNDIVKNYSIFWEGFGFSGGKDGISMKLYNPSSGRFSNYTEILQDNEEGVIKFSADKVNTNTVNLLDNEGFVHALVYTNTVGAGSGDDRSYLRTNYVKICDIEFIASYPITAFSRGTIENDKEDKKIVAYDEMQDRFKVSVEDSTTRKFLEEFIRYERQGAVVETLFEGELESDGYVNDICSLYRGENETRILVSTDQEGFRMIVGAGPFDDVESFYNGTTYPNTFNINDIFTEDSPLHVLPIYRGAIDVDENTTWEQAYQHRQLNDFRLSFRNTASEKANVTIKIMRIFK